MNQRKFVEVVPSLAVLAASAPCYSMVMQEEIELQTIILPKPKKDGGKSVLASLMERKTTRTCFQRCNTLKISGDDIEQFLLVFVHSQ